MTSVQLMRILLVGKDARTHALAVACANSAAQPELSALSECRIPGLGELCDLHVLPSLSDVPAMLEKIDEIAPDLVVVGPEEPLGAGIADELLASQIPCFGPTRDLARIETSKSWARELLDRHGIPGNPAYRVLTDVADLRPALDALGAFVVKPDGLTAGKGVRVFGEHITSMSEAYDYAAGCIRADGRVVVEERLDGEEFSLQTITDGFTAVHCPLVQDHKRAGEGDTGPNTGGMGSYSCPDGSLPFLDPSDVEEAKRINEAVVAALHVETGERYRGVLYGGFMATRDGIRLIEYNARFGDPEAMNVLPVLTTDFVELCMAVVEGRLGDLNVSFAPKATVCKYVVPKGYPETKNAGDRIEIESQGLDGDRLHVYWAAADQRADGIYLTGSRAVAFVGIGDTLAEAERWAERGARSVRHESVRHRRDIGTAELVRTRVEHMAALRGA